MTEKKRSNFFFRNTCQQFLSPRVKILRPGSIIDCIMNVIINISVNSIELCILKHQQQNEPENLIENNR